MFQNIKSKHSDQELSPSNVIYLANLPQTPFQFSHTKPDKNGGLDSLKYNSKLLKEFKKNAKLNNCTLVMLYSYMSNPRRFF